MERPVARLSTFIVSASVIGFLLAGCSPNANNVVIGVPPTAPPVVAPPPNGFDSGLEQAVQLELKDANSIQSDGVSQGVLVDLNALTGINQGIRAEAFSSLLVTGYKETITREGYVNALIADVQSNPYLGGITVSGRSLSATLLSMLAGVNSQLQELGARIQSDSQADVLRSDVLSIIPSTRVAGLIRPMTHLAIAGGDILRELNDLTNQYQTLQSQVAGVPSSDPNKSLEVAKLGDLAAAIASARQTVISGVGAVLSLTPSGFPSNKQTVASVRNALIEIRAPLGKLGTAKAVVNVILALLAN